MSYTKSLPKQGLTNMTSPSDNDKNKDAASDAKASGGENKADKFASAKETLNKIIYKTGVLVGKIFAVSKAATKDVVQELRNVNTIRKETVATAAEGAKKTDLAKTFWTKTSGKQRGIFLGLTTVLITLTILLIPNKNIQPPIVVGIELKCMTIKMDFFNGKSLTTNKPPANTKPVFYKFDGKNLSAVYKLQNSPSVAGNGAKYIGTKTVIDTNRKFITSQFELKNNMHHTIEFFYEPSSKISNKINMVHRFSDNNFSTYGEYLSSCTNES